MNVSEHLVRCVTREFGCHHAFTLTGGGAMFLNDAFGNSPELKAVYMHHEQAAAMAAVGYAKLRGLGVCVTTTGCGATNALTGLLDAWQDNVPVLFISGQVKSKETSYLSQVPVRTFGVQEFNIIPVVKSFTKAAYFINGLDSYLEMLKKLRSDLFSGRPGPVWLDIPMDVQSLRVSIPRSNVRQLRQPLTRAPRLTKKEVSKLKKAIAASKKPVFLVGNGLRLSCGGSGIESLQKLAESALIPVATTYLGVDFLPRDSPVSIGPVGIKASRVSNLIVNNADLLICVGTRLATSVTGFEYEKFAPNAKIIIIDIDPDEHKKDTIKPALVFKSDAKAAIETLARLYRGLCYQEWSQVCRAASQLLPKQEQHSPRGRISIYDVIQHICSSACKNDVVVSDAGSAYYVASIMFSKTANQRYVTSGAQADMGFGLPAGIGCAFAASKGSRVHVVTGDGSFQLNIQELQTLATYHLDVTIYVLNNNGYLSIRSTQKTFFPGRLCGTDSSNGVDFPDIKKISSAYGIPYQRLTKVSALSRYLADASKRSGPRIVEIMCPENEAIIPRATTSRDKHGKLVSLSLSRMAPSLTEQVDRTLQKMGLSLE